jgi:hypothetical protein
MAHDSGFCGDPGQAFGATLADLPLSQASLTGFRQPYVGVFTQDGAIHEATNAGFGKLRVYLPAGDETPHMGKVDDRFAFNPAMVPVVQDDPEPAPVIVAAVAPEPVPAPVEKPAPVADVLVAPTLAILPAQCAFATESRSDLPRQIKVGETISGEGFQTFLAQSAGFWSVESNGVWIGNSEGHITFAVEGDVPAQGLALRVQGATFNGQDVRLAITTEDGLMRNPQTVAGDFVVDLPLNPIVSDNVRAGFAVEQDVWGCPAADGQSLDQRALATFIKAVQLVPANPALRTVVAQAPTQKVVAAVPAAVVAAPTAEVQVVVAPAPEAVEPVAAPAPEIAVAPEPETADPASTSVRMKPFPIEIETPLHRAIDQGQARLDDGWKMQTLGGYETAGPKASVWLRLPNSAEDLFMILESGDDAPLVDLTLSWQDLTITAAPGETIGQARYDLRELPRNLDILLTLERAASDATAFIKSIELNRQP